LYRRVIVFWFRFHYVLNSNTSLSMYLFCNSRIHIGRVVKRPCGGHRFFKTQNFGLVVKTWLNWRPGEALRWKGETVGWEGRGVGMWQVGTSKVVAPIVTS
jgi:hypothetical protein